MKRTPTRLRAKVSAELERSKFNVEARCKCSEQIGRIVSVYAQILAQSSGRRDTRRSDAGLLCNQTDNLL